MLVHKKNMKLHGWEETGNFLSACLKPQNTGLCAKSTRDDLAGRSSSDVFLLQPFGERADSSGLHKHYFFFFFLFIHEHCFGSSSMVICSQTLKITREVMNSKQEGIRKFLFWILREEDNLLKTSSGNFWHAAQSTLKLGVIGSQSCGLCLVIVTG